MTQQNQEPRGQSQEFIANNPTDRKIEPNQGIGNTCLARLQNCYKSVTAMYGLFFPLFQWEDLSWLSYTCLAIICCNVLGGPKSSFKFFHKIQWKNLNELFGPLTMWGRQLFSLVTGLQIKKEWFSKR